MSRSFAHLLGLGGPAAARAEDEDDKKRDEDMRKAKGGKADNDDDNDPGKDTIDDVVDEVKDENDDDRKTDTDEKDDAKKGKRAKKAKADDDDDEEQDSSMKAARARERARCAAIFSHTAAATRPDLAAHLAFETTIPRGAAVNLLAATALGSQAPAAAQPRRQMQTPPNPDVGPDAGKKLPEGAAGFAAKMARVDKIRRGEAS